MSMYSEDYVPPQDDYEYKPQKGKRMTDTKPLAITEDESTLTAIAATKNDLAMMTEKERTKLYGAVCRSIGLNPLTAPFEYIKLNGKLTLYAKKGATDQIRDIKRISITKIEKEVEDGVLMVTATAQDATGRIDTDMGAVVLTGLKGENLANAHMKAITKAKRRVTLSMAGLGFLDETEIESIPESRAQVVTVDHATGEIHQPQPRQIAARPQIKGKGPHTPPTDVEFYDPDKETDPEGRKKVLQRFILTMQDAGMGDNHRAALTWGAGYHGSAKNVPTPILNQWITAIKAKPDVWKNRAEELMIDMIAEQENMQYDALEEQEDDSEDTPDYIDLDDEGFYDPEHGKE